MDEIIALLEKDINKRGELHLDAERTRLFFRWIRAIDITMDSQHNLCCELGNRLLLTFQKNIEPQA